jgi:hypothetical protein
VDIELNVGSGIAIPVPFGWQVSVDDTSIISITRGQGRLKLTAVAPGDCWLTVQPNDDTKFMLLVTVV